MTIGDSFTIGPYAFEKMEDVFGEDGYWIQKDDGEGMGISEKELIELLDKFWKEYF